jgi:hypothetical protein
MDEGRFSISADDLYQRLGSAAAPVVIDARRAPAFEAVVRANALEDNVRFYRVAKGRREQLAGAHTKVSAKEWHTLGIRTEGEGFTLLLDGKALFTTTDKIFRRSRKGRALDQGGQRDPLRRDLDHTTALTNFPATRMETGVDHQP